MSSPEKFEKQKKKFWSDKSPGGFPRPKFEKFSRRKRRTNKKKGENKALPPIAAQKPTLKANAGRRLRQCNRSRQ